MKIIKIALVYMLFTNLYGQLEANSNFENCKQAGFDCWDVIDNLKGFRTAVEDKIQFGQIIFGKLLQFYASIFVFINNKNYEALDEEIFFLKDVIENLSEGFYQVYDSENSKFEIAIDVILQHLATIFEKNIASQDFNIPSVNSYLCSPKLDLF